MKPPRSLMALAAVFLCAASAQAASWLEVKAGAQSYFINKANHDQLKAAKIGDERKLFDKPDGKDAGAVLRKKANNVYVVVKGGAETAVSSVAGVTPPPKKKAEQPKTAYYAPASGHDDVVAAIKTSEWKSEAHKADILAMMDKLKAKNPAEYARMLAGGKNSIMIVANKMSFALKTNQKAGKNDVEAAYAEFTRPLPGKGSMLTVSLDESNAPVVDTSKNKKPESVVGVGDSTPQDGQEAGQKDLVNVLTTVIGKARGFADTDLPKRFSKFLLEEEGGAYISAAVRKDPKRLKDIEGYVDAWVKKASPADLAVLYIVMGSGGQAPGWVGDKDLGQLLEKAARLPKLKTYMLDWTKPGAQGARGQLQQGSTAEVAAFFSNDSPDKKVGGLVFAAWRIINENRTDPDIRLSVIKNEEAPVIPDNVGDPDLKIKDPALSFNFDGLYLRGGATGRIYAPGDKHSRDLSVKLYTERVDGQLVTKLGIWDVTNQSNVFGQNFDISGSGSSTFPLDDRKPGYPKYVLKYEPDGNDTKVILMREGGKDGGKIVTSLGALYHARAKQAADEGAPIVVGGKKFLSLGQGGNQAGVVMYPEDTGKRLAAGEVLDPELFAATTKRGQGRDLNKPGKQSLGQVDGKDYHLAYNSQLRYWQVGEGKGDEPKPKAAEDKTVTTPTTSGSTDKTDKKEGGETPTTTVPEDAAAREALFTSNGDYERNKDVQNGLDEKYRETVRVYSWIKPSESGTGVAAREIGRRHVMVVPEAINPNIFSHVPFLKNEADDMTRKKGEVRGIGKYLATTTDMYTAYFDVTKKSDNPNLVFHTDLECFVDERKKTFCARDMSLLPDAMGRSGFKTADIDTVKARAAKQIGSEAEYWVKNSWDENAKKAGPVVAVIRGKGTCVLFPKEAPCSSTAGGEHEDTKNASVGPANAFDKLILAPSEDFPKDPQTVDNGTSKDTVHLAKVSDDKQAALYSNHKEAGKATVWYLMFNITLRDGKKARTGFIPVFDSNVKFPGLDKVHFGGIALNKDRKDAPDISATGELRRGSNPSKGQGVYYAVEEKGVKSPDKQLKYPNCVGPVLWWGLDQSKAKDACDENAL